MITFVSRLISLFILVGLVQASWPFIKKAARKASATGVHASRKAKRTYDGLHPRHKKEFHGLLKYLAKIGLAELAGCLAKKRWKRASKMARDAAARV